MRTRVPMSRRVVVTISWASAVLLSAGSATASTVSVAPNPLTGGKVVLYDAGVGEVNQVDWWDGANSFVQVQDGGAPPGVVIDPQLPCVSGQGGTQPPAQPNNFANCPKTDVDLIAAELGDGDDSFSGMIFFLPVSVAGGAGGDNIRGGNRDDALFGDEGQDLLFGNAGNDLLDGGLGADLLVGGGIAGFTANSGFDLADYSERFAAVTVTLDGRTDDGEAGEGDNVDTSVDDVLGGTGADVIVGSDLSNALYGEAGNDTITGGAGPDLLDGDAGDDVIEARDGAVDDVRCGPGNDRAVVDVGDAVAPDCETVERPTAPAPAPAPVVAVAPPAVDRSPPKVSMTLPRRPSLRSVLARGLRIRVVCSEACAIKAELQISRAAARLIGLSTRGSKMVVVGRGAVALRPAGRRAITVRFTAKARKALRRLRQPRLTLRLTATDAVGNRKTLTTTVKPRRP